MQDDKDNVVDLAAARREARRRELERKGYRQFAIEEMVGPVHESPYEAQALIDRVLARAEIYEKAGRPDEAERIRSTIRKVLDEIRLGTPPWYGGKEIGWTPPTR